MKRKWIILTPLALACVLLLTGVALAAPEAASLDWYVIGGGGGHAESANGALTLDSTMAQPVAGIAGPNLCSGFLRGFDWLTMIKIFLPLILP